MPFSPDLGNACIKILGVLALKAEETIAILAWTCKPTCLKTPFVSDKVHEVPVPVNSPQFIPQSRTISNLNGILSLLYPDSFGFNENYKSLLETIFILCTHECGFRAILCGCDTNLLLSSERLPEPRVDVDPTLLAACLPDLKVCIRTLGIVELVYLKRLFQGADDVLLPSLVEGLSRPLAEAVACGVSVLCSDIPPFREQIETYDLDKNVTIVERVDVQERLSGSRCLLNQPPIMNVSLPAIHERLSK